MKTPREIYENNQRRVLLLALFAAVVFLVFIGVAIEQSITNGAEQNARVYQTALQTTSDKQLNYAIDTKQGNVFAEVTIHQTSTVKFPEMNKEFPAVEKTEETYTRHYRTVCTTVSDGNGGTRQQCHQETYYSWDETDSWDLVSPKVKMADREYPTTLFALRYASVDASEIVPGATGKYVIKEKDQWIDWWGSSEGDKRYSYRVLNLPQSGTVFLNVSEGVKPVFGNKIDLKTEKPQQLVEQAQNAAQAKSTVFTVFWVILIIMVIGFGVYGIYQHTLDF